jgi:hypothetical protein
VNNPISRPRIPYEIIFAVGGWSGDGPTGFIETYDIQMVHVYEYNGLKTPGYHGLCASDNLIYVIGSFDGNEHIVTWQLNDRDSCEGVASQRDQEPLNTEPEESALLEAVARQRLVKIN